MSINSRNNSKNVITKNNIVIPYRNIKYLLVLFVAIMLLDSCSNSVKFSSNLNKSGNENISNVKNNDKKLDNNTQFPKQFNKRRNSDNVAKNNKKLNNPNPEDKYNNDIIKFDKNHFNPYKPIPKSSKKLKDEEDFYKNNEINSHGELIVHHTNKWLGTPYKFGGIDESGIDCSALVQNVYNDSGIKIPRTSNEQYEFCDLVEPDDRKVGDLVFFAAQSTISHVGIYAGENEVIHASSSQGVIKQSIFSNFLFNNFVSFGRVTKEMSLK